MISLHNLQREILGCALGEQATAPNKWIVENGLTAARRLAVYRNNAHIGFANALHATFPVLVRLSGEDWFNQTALCYQRVHPSRSGDLGEVGSAFASFLASTLSGGDYEYFADVARLEWAYSETLNKRAAGPANFENLESLSDDDYSLLCFRINPTASLIESPYPLFAIWTNNQCGVENPPIVHLSQGGSQMLLIRRADHVDVHELAPCVFSLLRAFVGGATVRAGADSVPMTIKQFDLTDALAQLIGLGALIGLQSTSAGGADVV